MSDISFNKAYETICERCHKKAGFHRLTHTGRTYCLVLNAEHRRETWRKQYELYKLPVRFLTRSDISIEVGAVLDYNLNSLLNAGIETF